MTSSPVLLAHLDQMTPVMEIDRPHKDRIVRVILVKSPTRTGLGLVNRSLVLFAHLNQMVPGMEINRPHQDRIVRVTPVKETDSHRTEFGDQIAGVICTYGSDGTSDGDRQPSSGLDSPGDPEQMDNSTRTVFGELIIGVMHTSGQVGLCDDDSFPPTGSDTPLYQFVCVYQTRSSGPDIEFGDVCERADVSAPGDVIVVSAGRCELPPDTFDKPCFDKTSVFCYEGKIDLPICPPRGMAKMDCTELIPLSEWFAASRGQPVLKTWIRSQ